MANAKWSGIEQWKYGLTANWYVSEQYGNDNDVDGVGLYDASTNPLGHGGKTRPFASSEKVIQTSTSSYDVIVFDCGFYSYISVAGRTIVGDGHVEFDNYNTPVSSTHKFYNVKLISFKHSGAVGSFWLIDCHVIYSFVSTTIGYYKNTVFVESAVSSTQSGAVIENILLINCTGSSKSEKLTNITIINSPLFLLAQPADRASGAFVDYSCIIGTVKSTYARNGKTTDVTIEDFKADGNYFIKSYSEVDLWGNASGSGASVAQLQEIFNNYFSPIYIDDFYFADFTLKPTVDDRIRYGGLNGNYIGAHPVAYAYSADTLWNTYRDAANTSNLELSNISGNIKMQVMDGQSEGTFRSLRIDFPQAITCDPVLFANSLVYDINGVAQEKVDYTDDPAPDNILDQRSVYDFKLAIAPTSGDAMGALELYELNREPTIDASGNTNMNDSFDPSTAAKQTFQSVIIEFKLKKL